VNSTERRANRNPWRSE